jgi:hypothetical protein
MTTTKTDYDYYDWLVSQIDIPNNREYSQLFERLHNVEFVWLVPNDDNRIGDALDLRTYFLDGRKGALHLQGATMLEILVSLSQKVQFTAGGNSRKWAWKLLKNLKLTRMNDPLSEDDLNRVDEILYDLIWREYEFNGQGGFFPLKDPKEDQTKVEIWFQMNKYVIEMSQH